MSIFISHTSALEYLRANGIAQHRSLSRAKPPIGSVPTRSLVAMHDLAAFGVTEKPLHLAVGNGASRSCSKAVKCHVWQGPNSLKSFVRIDDTLYASTADACLLQLATVLPLVELTQLAYEFCGSYTLDPIDPHGFRAREPLTSTRTLEKYLSKAQRVYGVKRACQALRLVVSGSASPMETIVAMLLCLPSAYGGYGLELPRLNQSIPMPDEVRAATRRKFCICDLFWPKAKLAVEYESDQWHTGPTRIASDSKRRAALELAGVSVVTVTSGQVFDARAFDEVARALAMRMGKPLRIQREGWLTKRFNLRSSLLAGPSAHDSSDGELK